MRYDRLNNIAIAPLTQVLNGSIICLVIWLKLHLAFLLLAQFIFGVAGGGSTLGIAVFSYSSDQHTKQLDTAETEAEGVKSTRTSISTVDSELRPERVPQSNESVEYQPADETHQYTETNVIDDSAPTSVAALGFGPAPEEASQSYESYGHRPTNQKQEKKAVESTTKRERDDGERSDGKNSNSKKPIAAPLLDKNRALRILIIECVSIVGRGCAQLTNGYFISFAGFFYPTLSATLFFAVTLIWTYFTIQTPKNPPKKTSIGQSIVQPLKTMFRAIRQPRRLSAFVLCNLGMMLIVFADGGNNRTLPIYQMSPPFCWTSVEIGWFESEFTFVLLLSIPLLYVLKRFRLSEPVMAGIGITFNVFGTLMYAIINGADWVFYVATYMVGGLSGSGMYQTTVAKLHSAVFFFYAALYATSALVY
nr:hypothetical protein BaRGS_025467 [Batillaria attramentaria]